MEGQLPACARLIVGRLSGCRLAAIVNVWNSAAPASGIAHISPPAKVGTDAVQISRAHPIAAGDPSHTRRSGHRVDHFARKARGRVRVRSSSAPASQLKSGDICDQNCREFAGLAHSALLGSPR